VKEALDSLDMCHQPDEGQFLTTTNAPSCSFTYQSLQTKSRKSGVVRNYFISMLMGRGEFES